MSNLHGLQFSPGSRFVYSNTNYILLAEVIKRVSRSRTSVYTKKKIFKPTGMNCTVFDDDRNKVVRKRVSSYTSPAAGSKTYYSYLKNSCTVGDGGVLSSINDLVKWEVNFLDNKKLPAGILHGLVERGKLATGDSIDYGNGLELSPEKSELSYSYHGGSFEGFVTYLLRVPSEKTSFVFLSNNEHLTQGVVWPHTCSDLIARDNTS